MNKRILILVTSIIALLAMAIPGVAFAHTNSVVASCFQNPKALVLNVSFLIKNDADSGTTTPEWAVDTINRTVQVYQVSESSFCAVVTDQGTFITVAGASPQAATDIGGTVSAGVTGTLSGGYQETFDGTLRTTSDGGQVFFGNIGTFDYQCTAQGECNKFDWLDNYFTEVHSVNMFQWGWTYHTACNDANGSWTNALGGNSGDITGSPTTCVTPTPVPPTPTPVPPTPTPTPPTPKLPKTGSDPA